MKTFIFIVALCGCVIRTVICDAYDAAHSKFQEWFINSGGVSSAIGLHIYKDMGRGVVATEDITKGTTLLQVPIEMTISEEAVWMRATKDGLYKTLKEKLHGSRSDIIAVAFLLLEKALGDKSDYAPYIALLPTSIPGLVTFNTDELSELHNAKLMQEVEAEQQQMRGKYDNMRKSLDGFLPEEILSYFTYENFVWADLIIDSRALRFHGQAYLIPFSDMFNYSPHPNKREAQQGEFYLAHHKLTDTDISILADREFRAGEQVFEDYGDSDDRIYLMHHGFLPYTNPFRCTTLVAPEITSLDDETKNFLGSLTFKKSPSVCMPADVKATIEKNKALVVYFASLVMTSNERDECSYSITANTVDEKTNWRQVFSECGFQDAGAFLAKNLAEGSTVPQLEENSLGNRVLAEVRQWVLAYTLESPTTVSEDESILMGLQSGEQHSIAVQRKQLAVSYRLAMKTHLQNIKKAFATPILEKPTVVQASIDDAGQVIADAREEADSSAHKSESSSVTNDPGLESEPHSSMNATGDADIEAGLEQQIDAFNVWYNTHAPREGNKLTAAVIPGFRIGTLASEPITAEEIYVTVPQSIIMDSDTALRGQNALGDFLRALHAKYERRDDQHELLFSLLYERTVLREQSFYWPYLQLLPQPADMDIPLMWSDEDVESRLGPSEVKDIAKREREKVKKTYDAIKKLDLVSEFLKEHNMTFKKYRWAMAILDSRSIWWDGKRHLVPMLDFINCKEGPDATRLHSTRKEGEMAITYAPWEFAKGEQVFENYGQPNHIYFMYHGFSLAGTASDEPNGGLNKLLSRTSLAAPNSDMSAIVDHGIGNTHDCLQIKLEISQDEFVALDTSKIMPLVQKYDIRDPRTMNTCLSVFEPIPVFVWLYLSIKVRDTDDFVDIVDSFDYERASESEYPLGTPKARAVLVDLLEKRLKIYEEYNYSASDGHASSIQFIMLERQMLRSLLAMLLSE